MGGWGWAWSAGRGMHGVGPRAGAQGRRRGAGCNICRPQLSILGQLYGAMAARAALGGHWYRW